MEDAISYQIVGAAIEVHKELGGPGLLESVYECCLCHELTLKGLKVERQIAVPVSYKGAPVKSPLYIDLLVEDAVIVEVKAIDKLLPVHDGQILTYLRLSGRRLGLLINFGQKYVKEGVKRVVNGL